MHDFEEIDYSLVESTKNTQSLESKVKNIIKHLENNEAVASFDASFYKKKLEELLKLK